MIGLDICGMSTMITEPILHEINDVTISGALFDAIRIDSEITNDFDISEEWTETTKLLALFEGNLYSGNVDLSVKNTSDIIIKRRKYGEFSWFNMFDIPVENADSFNFNIIDRYANAHTQYQYAVVPVINGLEGEYNFGKNELTDEDFIECEFDGIVILDRDTEYSTFCNLEMEFQKNQGSNYVVPLNSKYPYIINNDSTNYYSGSISAAFLKFENCEYFKLESVQYREDFLNFLINDNFKILKIYDGRSYMIEIVDTPTDSNSEHPELHIISFNFVEVGDPLSNEDMYLNGFLDISEAWWNT